MFISKKKIEKLEDAISRKNLMLDHMERQLYDYRKQLSMLLDYLNLEYHTEPEHRVIREKSPAGDPNLS